MNKNDKKFYLLKKIEISENKIENEAEILKNIAHQNIVKYYYAFPVEPKYYIIM